MPDDDYTAQVGDVGTIIRVTIKDDDTGIGIDISDATTTEIIVRKPDLTTVTWAAVFATDGSDGILDYTTVSGDLDVAGSWEVQPRVITPDVTWRGSRAYFQVEDNV